MFRKLITNQKGEWLFVGILLLFFITDSLNVIIFKGDFEELVTVTKYTKISAYSKLLFLIGYFIYYLINDIKSVIKVLVVGLFFILFSLSIYGYADLYVIFTWLLRFSKLLLPILLFDLLLKIKPVKNSFVFNVYLTLIVVQVVVVLISAVFKLDLFRTYGGVRFGYAGFLFAQNEATFYYVITSVFVFKYWQNTKNISYLLILFLILIASVLLGTKAIFLFLGSFAVFLGWYYKLYTKISFWIGGIIISGLFVTFLYKAGVVEYYLHQAGEEGWMFMITSKRNILIQERLPVVFEQWHWYNYLFGGVNPATSFVEMDIIDLFLFGGLVGSILYYWLLFKTIFHFSKNNHLGWFLVSQYFLIGGLAGHVFASGINAIYLALTSYYLQKTNIT